MTGQHIYFYTSFCKTKNEWQFVDRGAQYSTAIFYANNAEKKIAEQSKKDLQEKDPYGKPIVTPILKFKSFHKAEDYHQDYHTNNPIRYKVYRSGSGRDKFLDSIWSAEESSDKPSQEELKSKLQE